MAVHETTSLTVAIGQTAQGRHYFVSIDGARFRQVPHFPLGPIQAQVLFDRQPCAETDRIELLHEYGSRISFMPVVG